MKEIIKKYWISIIILLIIIFVVIKSSSYNKTSESSEQTDYKLEAYVMSQDFMKTDYLTNPSTSKFPYYSEINVIQTDNRYKVEAFVESKNAFGATIKTDYYMVLERDDDGGWTKISCTTK